MKTFFLQVESCKLGEEYPCSGIFGHTKKKFYEKRYEECLSLCCKDPKCQSFDHRMAPKYKYNCAIIYETINDAGDAYRNGTCEDVSLWNHYKVHAYLHKSSTK